MDLIVAYFTGHRHPIQWLGFACSTCLASCLAKLHLQQPCPTKSTWELSVFKKVKGLLSFAPPCATQMAQGAKTTAKSSSQRVGVAGFQAWGEENTGSSSNPWLTWLTGNLWWLAQVRGYSAPAQGRELGSNNLLVLSFSPCGSCVGERSHPFLAEPSPLVSERAQVSRWQSNQSCSSPSPAIQKVANGGSCWRRNPLGVSYCCFVEMWVIQTVQGGTCEMHLQFTIKCKLSFQCSST